MAISQCSTAVDSSGRELVSHGTLEFPIACYYDDFQITDVPWHWHQEWEAVILTSGTCLVAAGSQKRTFRAGEGFFINSGVLHGCWDAEHSGCRFHSMVFHPRLVGGSLDSIFHTGYIQPLLEHPALELLPLSPEIPWQKQALSALEGAWQSCVLEGSGYPFQVRELLSQLVFLLHSHLPAAPAPGSKASRDAQRIKAMLSFIHDHCADPLTIREIAASASLGESECLRCFRSTIGTTPIQYLKHYRIQQAAALLTQTQDKISDIAGRCGFQDLSYFTRSFREEKGCTPTQYRKTASPL